MDEKQEARFDEEFCITAGDPPQTFGLGDWIDEHQIKDFISSLLSEQKEQILPVLKALLGRYVGIVDSGDAGFWNPEDEKEVKDARALLASLDT